MRNVPLIRQLVLFENLTGPKEKWPNDVRRAFFARDKSRTQVFRIIVHGLINGIPKNVMFDYLFYTKQHNGDFTHRWIRQSAHRANATLEYIYKHPEKYHSWDTTAGMYSSNKRYKSLY